MEHNCEFKEKAAAATVAAAAVDDDNNIINMKKTLSNWVLMLVLFISVYGPSFVVCV